MRFSQVTLLAALAAGTYAVDESFRVANALWIQKLQTTIETTTTPETAAEKKKWNDKVIKDATAVINAAKKDLQAE